MRCFLAFLSLVTLVGCNTPAVKPPVVVVPPTGPITSAQIVALEEQISRQGELLQRASGAVWGAQDANALAPKGLPQDAVTAQLQEAASALPAPTPEQVAAKAAQNARILAGELDAVRAEMGVKISENEALKTSLDRQEKALADLAAKAAKERGQAAAELQAQFDKFAKLIADANTATAAAEKRANDAVMQRQVEWLNRAAVACGGLLILVVGATSIFGGIAALRAVAPFAGLLLIATLSCAGLAQIVGLAWFKWAILGSVVLALGVAGWWAYSKYRQGLLKEAAEQQAAKLSAVTRDIVPVLDKAYEEASADVKKLLDDIIFTPLKGEMDKAQKATIKEIRATAP